MGQSSSAFVQAAQRPPIERCETSTANDRRRSSVLTRDAASSVSMSHVVWQSLQWRWPWRAAGWTWNSSRPSRSEEHTSELQSQFHLVCRLLLEKKKKKNNRHKKNKT